MSTQTERKNWICKDCKKDTFIDDKDYYMLKNDVWKSFNVHGMLCMDCVEARLKRKINKNDLFICPLNFSNPYTAKIITGNKKQIN